MLQLQTVGRMGAALVLLVVLPALACEGGWRPLPIEQKDPTSTKVFTGRGKSVVIEFVNDTGRADVDAFPEPPLTIRGPAQTGCEVDGGIWGRNSAYLSQDERTLLLQESSGSNADLVFYDTSNCKERSRLDVSGARWEMRGAELVVGRMCGNDSVASCKRLERFGFDAACLPKSLRGAKQ